jgi:hypothetical protein
MRPCDLSQENAANDAAIATVNDHYKYTKFSSKMLAWKLRARFIGPLLLYTTRSVGLADYID